MKKYLAILLTIALLLSVTQTALGASVNGTATPNAANGVVTVTGRITSQVAGQKIAILIVEYGTDLNSITDEDVVYMDQTISDSNGDYSHSFIMPVAKRTGTYDVYIGATNVETHDQTSLTYPTEAPTAAPVAPVVDMATAKPAVNGANAFYYVVSITLNDGEASAFTVKHYPFDKQESQAASDTISLQGISGTTIKIIAALKGIPDAEADRSITSKAILSYTIGGNSDTTYDMKTTTLNTTQGN